MPGIDENGVEMEHGLLQEPPAFTGVRLKDGTMHIGISNGLASSNYVDQESSSTLCTIASLPCKQAFS